VTSTVQCLHYCSWNQHRRCLLPSLQRLLAIHFIHTKEKDGAVLYKSCTDIPVHSSTVLYSTVQYNTVQGCYKRSNFPRVLRGTISTTLAGTQYLGPSISPGLQK